MYSIEAALAWDFARRGAMVIPLVLVTMIAIPLWLFEALGRDGILDPTQREAVALHVTLTLAIGFGAAIAVIQAQGKAARFFPRPISAARLVGVQMALGMATMAAIYVLAAAALNLRGVGWPLLGPAMFLATILACGLAMIWSLEGSVLGQLLGCTATSVPLVIWFNRCYGATYMGDWRAMWRNPTAAEAVTLAAISAAAFGVAIVGTARVRRGDVCDLAAFWAWWERVTASTAAPTLFSNPVSALVWCERQEKFTFAPAVLIAGFMLFVSGGNLAGWMTADKFMAFLGGIPLLGLMLILPVVFGLVLGNCNGAKSGPSMKHYLASLPVTDSLIAGALLRNVLLGLVAAWVTWVVLYAIAAAAVATPQNWQAVGVLIADAWRRPGEFLPFLLVPLIFPWGSWTFTALSATLLATGRPWLFASVLFSGFGLGIVAMIFKNSVSPRIFEECFAVASVAVGMLALAGTTAAFVAAVRTRVLSKSAALTALGAWTLVSLVALGAWREILLTSGSMLLLVAGGLALGLLPFAAMPLAVRWNRHR